MWSVARERENLQSFYETQHEEGKEMVVSHGMRTLFLSPIRSCSTKLTCVCYEKCMKTSLAVVNNLLAFCLLEKETLMCRAYMYMQ